MSDIDRILADWCEARQQGRAPDPEQVIRDHPELATELRAAFAALGPLDAGFAELREVEKEPEHPREIGDYKIVRELGRGGMGVVYEAEQISMERRVALKVLSLAITGAPDAIRRFQREAKAAGRLHHTNIVPVYAMGQHAGYWFYAMELVEGRPLSGVIAEMRALGRPAGAETTPASSHPLTGTPSGDRTYFGRVAEMFSDVAAGVEAAHQEGVFHRDIKPSNLLLDADGVLKIVDFGLARFGEETVSMTRTGDLVGTPSYMSPEQAMAKRMGIDHRTDVYSLGATLYEVLTLRPPFDGKSLPEICAQIITKDPVLPRRSNSRIPRDLETIVCKAMEKDRDKRYQTAQAFARDLRTYAEGGAIRARRIGPLGRTWRKIKRHKVRSALTAAALVLGAAAAFFAFRHSREATRRADLEYAELLARGDRTFRKEVEYGGPVTLSAQGPASAVFARAIKLLPQRPEAYFQRALVGGDLAQRLADLDAARERGLPARTYHLARARVFGFARRWEESEQEKRQAAEFEGSSPTAALLEAHLLELDGQREEALQRYTAAAEASAESSMTRWRALWGRSLLRDKTGDLSGALEDLVAVRASGFDCAYAQVRVASLWRRLGQTDRGEALFEDVLADVRREGTAYAWDVLCDACWNCGEFSWHERAAEEAVAEHEGSVELLSQLSRARTQARRVEEALALIDTVLRLVPDSASAHANRAGNLCRLQRYEDAAEAAERAVSLDPSLIDGHNNLGAALMSLVRFGEALAAFERAIELRPFHPALHGNRAAVLGLLGRPEEALAAADRALELRPGSREHSGRSDCLRQLGRIEEALAAAERAVELAPDSDEAHIQRGRALHGLGRHEQGLDAFNSAVDLNPTGRALADRSWQHLVVGMRAEALADAERASELAPRDASVQKRAGATLCFLGRAEEARHALERAIRLNPGDADTRVLLARALRMLGRYEEALSAVDGALALMDRQAALNERYLIRQRNVGTAHAVRGGILAGLGRYEDALESYDRAIALDPRWPETHTNRAAMLAALGRTEEALAAAEAALELRPGHVTARRHRAVLLVRLGRIDEGMAACDELEAEGQMSAVLANNVAYALATARPPVRIDRALALARKAVAAAPGSADCHGTLGVVHLYAGQIEEARECLEKALALRKPGESDTAYNHLFLAIVHHRLGNTTAARDAYERAVACTEAHQSDDAELKRVRAEAEKLLGSGH